MIQHKVILGITVLLWAARYEHVIVPEEVLQAGDLKGEKIRKKTTFRMEWGPMTCLSTQVISATPDCVDLKPGALNAITIIDKKQIYNT